MSVIKRKNGFTLIELIVVIAIIAILGAILIPHMIGLKEESKQRVCEANRSEIIRYYHYMKALDNGDGSDIKLSEVLAGEYGGFTEEIIADMCPDGGTYVADDEKETITCSLHGSTTGNNSGNEEDNDDPAGEDENTENYLYLTGDTNYKVATWGDLEKFEPEHDGEPGMIIPTGTVFYYQDDYYLFRDNQYFTNSTNIPTYVANYGVKLNHTAFTTPSADTEIGDVKLVNEKAYVFYPYSRFWHDYLNDGCWYEVPLDN